MSFPNFKVPLNEILKPLQELQPFLAGASGFTTPQQFVSDAGSGSDDTGALQDAIDSLPTEGGAIYLPQPASGEYNVTDEILIEKPIHFVGLAAQANNANDTATVDFTRATGVIIKCQASSPITSFVRIVDTSAHLSNITFDSNGKATYGVKLDRFRGGVIDNCAFFRPLLTAMLLGSSDSGDNGSFQNDFFKVFLGGPNGLELNFFDGGSTGAFFNHFHSLHVETEAYSPVSVTVDNTTDFITQTAHGYANGTPIMFAASVIPGGLSATQVYFVVNKTTNTYQVATSYPATSVAPISSNGTTVTVIRQGIGINMQAGDNNIWYDPFAFTWPDHTTHKGVGILLGTSLLTDHVTHNPQGAYNNYFLHPATNKIIVQDDSPIAGAIIGLDKQSGATTPDPIEGTNSWIDVIEFGARGVAGIAKLKADVTLANSLTILGALTGTNGTLTKGDAAALLLRSGDANKYTTLSLGRTSEELHVGVSETTGGTGTFGYNDGAGDIVVGLPSAGQRILIGDDSVAAGSRAWIALDPNGVNFTNRLAFVAPTLLNSWTNLGTPIADVGYVLWNGVVQIRGTATGGTTGIGNPIFTLPAGLRPSKTLNFAIVSNSVFGWVWVTSAGDVEVRVGNNAFVCLDGISFIPV